MVAPSPRRQRASLGLEPSYCDDQSTTVDKTIVRRHCGGCGGGALLPRSGARDAAHGSIGKSTESDSPGHACNSGAGGCRESRKNPGGPVELSGLACRIGAPRCSGDSI